MSTSDLPERYRHLEIPDRVTFLEGTGELPKVRACSPAGEADVYLHGAHVTHFQKPGEAPLLFLSKFSRFGPDQAIRGGIPFIFPWFGAREGEPMHGFARLVDWELTESLITAENAVRLRFSLPDVSPSALYPPCSVDYIVTVSDTLDLRVLIANLAEDTPFPLELCLHSYFAVADIRSARINGLAGTQYLDKVEDFTRKTQTAESIEISSEIDRVYLDTQSAVEILDPGNHRVIRIEKEGSRSTVVWNPWSRKAQQMPDLGDDEYLHMVCVESGNVSQNSIELPPGQTTTLSVRLSSSPLPHP